MSYDHKEYCRSYYQRNKDARKLYFKVNRKRSNAYYKKRLATDPAFKLAHNLRARLNWRIKYGRAGSAIKDLGCSVQELKQYLESKFQSGMNWNNYGKWHIDHIKPLKGFDLTDRNQFLVACHFTNLQPLWAVDNLRKGSKDVI